MSDIKVSVIIPVYNTEKYIEQCLESVINQTLKNIEIICVDDGSTDNSLMIMEKLAQNDARISVYIQNNCGVSAARNRGIKEAKGEYLFFLDSDDILEKNALESLSEFAEKEKLQVLYCDGTSFSDSDECKEAAEKFHNYYTRKNEYPAVTTGKALMIAMLKNQEYRATCCLHIVRRDYFINHHLWFIEHIVHEDNYYVFSCMLNAEKAGYIHIAPYIRRVRENSIMTKKQAFINSYGYFVDYEKMKSFLKERSFSEEESAILYDLVYKHFRNARDIYGRIEDSEKEKVNELPAQEKLFYQAYIIDYMNMKNKLKSKCEMLQGQKETISSRLENVKHEKEDLIKEQQRIREELQLANKETAELEKKYSLECKEKQKISKELEKLQKDSGKKEKQIEQMTNEIERLNRNIFVRLNKVIEKIVRKIRRTVKR